LLSAAGILIHLTFRSGVTDTAAVSALTVAQFKDLSGQVGIAGAMAGAGLGGQLLGQLVSTLPRGNPGLVRIHRELAPKGLQIVGIAVDSADNARKSAAQLGVSYPVLVAGMEVIDLNAAPRQPARGTAYTLILDRNGKIVATHLGLISEAELTRIITPLLG